MWYICEYTWHIIFWYFITNTIITRLNGIFGNTDLIFYYLEAIDEILQKQKQEDKGTTSSPQSANHALPKSSKLARVSDDKYLTEKKPEESIGYLLQQVITSANSIQKCAEHQKCMTDDVLQLSRLRSHKLAIANAYYNPWDTVMTAVSIFKPQAESKVLYIHYTFIAVLC